MSRGEVEPILALTGLIQLAMAAGTLTAWFFMPLFAITTPIFSIRLMPWGIVVRAPGVEGVLGVGAARLILGLLIATTLLSAIAWLVGGALRFALHFASFLTTAFAYTTLANVAFLMNNLEEQLWSLVSNNTQLLISVGKIVMVNGQEAVLIPIDFAYTLTYVLGLLMAFTIINSMVSFSTRH